MEKIRKRPLFVFLILLIGLYVVIYVVPAITGALRSSYTVKYGRLEVYDEQEGTFVRDETVYAASSGGTANRYIKEGKLVRKGTRILDIVESDSSSQDSGSSSAYQDLIDRLGSALKTEKSYTAANEGVVSYTADGLEAELTPKTMLKLKKSYYDRAGRNEVVELDADRCAKGDPVFKIADRAKWYIVTFVDPDHADRYKKGASVEVRINDEKTIKGTVYAVRKKGSSVLLAIETNYYYKSFASTRTAQVRTITSDASGLIIQNSSIGKQKGQEGVWARQKDGSYKFVPIRVIATDGEHTVVQQGSFVNDDGVLVDTLEPYDEVLKHAK